MTAIDLQDAIVGHIFFEDSRNKVSKRMKNDRYMDIFAGYTNSIFQDFENYLRTQVDLVQNDIRLALDEFNSSFITYDLPPAIHIFKDPSQFLLRNLESEYEGVNNTVDMEHDDIRLKTKMLLRPGFKATRFMKNRFSVLFDVVIHIGILNSIKSTLVKTYKVKFNR